MPSNPAINPFNYDIDYFQSSNLGPITDTNFRTFLFTHNLPVANSVISGVLGGNPWQSRGTEYNVSQSNPNVTDVPNLQEVAQTPSFYNNLTNPRQVNLTNNLQNLDPQVQNVLGQTTPIQAGLGQDATSLFNPTIANVDLPGPEDAAQIPSTINNYSTPRYDNLDRNPTSADLLTWYPIEFASIYNAAYGSYDTSYGVPQTFRLGFVGNTESWVTPAGTVATTNEVRRELFLTKNNKYGPNQMLAYSITSADEVVNSNTGLIQYNAGIQGDFRDQIFSRTLGVGAIPFSTLGSGINYKPDGQNISELDKIGRKRRGDELKQRIKLNFTDNTVGALNVSPFSLLGGGNLIQQNYTITVPKTVLGKVAQFAADLAGFNLPTSIIPDDAFGIYGVNPNDVDITNDILGYTGSGQKSLLYNSLYINKYGPKLESSDNQPTTKLGKILKEKLGAGQAPNTQNYLNYVPETTNDVKRSNSLIDNINEKVKSLLGKSSENPKDLRSKVFEEFGDNSPNQDGSDKYGGFYGRFEQYNSVGQNPTAYGPSDFNGNVPFYDDKDKNLTTYNGTPVEQDRDITFSVTDERFDWRATKENTFKRGLLKYTQNLVNKSKLKSAAGYIGYFDSEGSTGALVNGAHQTGAKTPIEKPNNPSKGNVARNYDFTNDTGGDSYCRSWSSRRKYHTWDNLVRSDGNWWRNPTSAGVDKFMTMNYDGINGGDYTGMPKIAWNSLDKAKGILKEANKLKGQVIPYMFSIENLAWKDAPQQIYLPKCEIGPNEGRIMWFPPYDLKFSESTSVSWDTTNFIGRGESIYTYNHTERGGTLDWTIIVDHSASLNQLRENFKKGILGDEGYNSYFAGCDNGTLKKLFADYLPENYDLLTELPELLVPTITPKEPSVTLPDIDLYFENCRTSEGIYASPDGIGRKLDLEKYEVTVPSIVNVNENDWLTNGSLYPCGPAGTGTTTSGGGYLPPFYTQNSYYLNYGKKEDLEKLAKFLVTEDGKNHKINVFGYTSPASPSQGFNKKLGQDRADNTKKELLKLMLAAENGKPPHIQGDSQYPEYPTEDNYPQEIRWNVTSKADENGVVTKCTKDCTFDGKPTCCDGNPCDPNIQSGQANSPISKELRKVIITLEPNLEIQTKLLLEIQAKEQESAKKKQIADRQDREKIANGVKTFITECDYFEDMKRTQPFVYQSLADKIKYFHPAFHSTTPEGFNSRLTFLQQCTRQGPQVIDPGSPQNMVFGRPPICVLRIGDFYHTKIVIDSLNITYEGNSGIQWDLNPEGIGVQPMIAKVSLSFKFIGGSSLGGPIKQLQNAVSYNFFANTSVYNPASVPLEDILSNRKFIYGSFKSPQDELDKMGGINGIEQASKEAAKDNASTNTSADPKKTEQNTETKAKIEETPPGGKDETKSTKGSAPSTNSAGPKLVPNSLPCGVTTADPNSSKFKYYIKINKGTPAIPCSKNTYLPISVSDPNGYKASNLGRVEFLNNKNEVVPYSGSGGSSVIIDDLPTGKYTMKVDYLFNGTPTQLTLDITT